ncbi:kinase-like protein [Trametopsis cervina]|nr:kinase-like protein [Trametopsis cervina]
MPSKLQNRGPAALKTGVQIVKEGVFIASAITPEPISKAVLQSLVLIIKEVENISLYKDKCKQFREKVKELLESLQQLNEARAQLSADALKALEDLESAMKVMSTDVARWAKYNPFATWWRRDELKKGLLGYETKLDHMLKVFTLALQVKTVATAIDNGKKLEAILQHTQFLSKTFMLRLFGFIDRWHFTELLSGPKNKKLPDVTLYKHQDDAGPIANIFRGRDLSDGGAMIVGKFIRGLSVHDEHAKQKLIECVEHHKDLEHPNIMKVTKVSTTLRSEIGVISPCHPNEDISKFCAKNEPDCNAIQLLAEAAEGLQYLHSQGVVHGNLKNTNILITKEEHAVVHDFEVAKFLRDTADQARMDRQLKDTAGRWRAPELWEEGPFLTAKCDVWAFGMVMVEILSGMRPLDHRRSWGEVMGAVMTREMPEKPYDSPWFSEDVWDVVLRCLASEADDRPDMDYVATRLRELSQGFAHEVAEEVVV